VLKLSSYRDPEAVSALTRCLFDEAGQFRLLAVEALKGIGGPNAEAALFSAVEQFDDYSTQRAAADALVAISSERLDSRQAALVALVTEDWHNLLTYREFSIGWVTKMVNLFCEPTVYGPRNGDFVQGLVWAGFHLATAELCLPFLCLLKLLVQEKAVRYYNVAKRDLHLDYHHELRGALLEPTVLCKEFDDKRVNSLAENTLATVLKIVQTNLLTIDADTIQKFRFLDNPCIWHKGGTRTITRIFPLFCDECVKVEPHQEGKDIFDYLPLVDAAQSRILELQRAEESEHLQLKRKKFADWIARTLLTARQTRELTVHVVTEISNKKDTPQEDAIPEIQDFASQFGFVATFSTTGNQVIFSRGPLKKGRFNDV